MILTRIGNKSKIANKIIRLFPKHDFFIDMFFGAGGIFYNKPRAKDSICNDIDDDVFNLFRVVQESPTELYDQISLTPIHESLWDYWRVNKEVDPVKKAVRFLFLSNFGYMGKSETISLIPGSFTKRTLLHRINKTFLASVDVKFTRCDFRELIPRIVFSNSIYNDHKGRAFIYADPPYLGTTNNYKDGFTENDSLDLFNSLDQSGIRYAMSELAHPFILDQAQSRDLNIIKVCEKQSLKKRDTEILITNYASPELTLF